MVTELEVVSWDGAPSAPLGVWSKERGMQRDHDGIAKHEAYFYRAPSSTTKTAVTF